MRILTNDGFDAVVLNRENDPIALVRVAVEPAKPRTEEALSGQLATFPGYFVFEIDQEHVCLYKVAPGGLGEPLAHLDTRETLRHYDPQFARGRVFGPYLLTLVEAWLRDLAYHWKSEEPPGAAALRDAGLLENLQGGTTQRLVA